MSWGEFVELSNDSCVLALSFMKERFSSYTEEPLVKGHIGIRSTVPWESCPYLRD